MATNNSRRQYGSRQPQAPAQSRTQGGEYAFDGKFITPESMNTQLTRMRAESVNRMFVRQGENYARETLVSKTGTIAVVSLRNRFVYLDVQIANQELTSYSSEAFDGLFPETSKTVTALAADEIPWN